jgi:hypothetical protein
MSRTVRVIFVLICVCCAVEFAVGQATKKSLKSGPSAFYPDDENRGFDEADPPSDAVLDALLKTQEAKENSDLLQKLDRDGLRKLFLVVQVHLAKSDETDEVVLGYDPMSGADCYWFWIVRDKGGHAQVLLFTNEYGIDLLNTRTNGYREIRGVWSSAAGYTITRVYQYNGNRYKLAHRYEKTDKVPQ